MEDLLILILTNYGAWFLRANLVIAHKVVSHLWEAQLFLVVQFDEL